MFYAIWPEGQPEQAFFCDKLLSSRWHLFKAQMKQLVKLHKARRMRYATCGEGYPYPQVVENSLMKSNAIPPPGGWRQEFPVSDEIDVVNGMVYVLTIGVV